MLTTECVESRFFKKIKFFGKDTENNANISRIYYFGFLLCFFNLLVFFKKKRSKIGLLQMSFLYNTYRVKTYQGLWVVNL